MTQQPMFKPNGDGYDISPACVLLLAADTIYGPPDETTPDGVRNAYALTDDILDAARAGGFMKNDILRTLLARRDPNRRLVTMAQEAVDAVGAGAMRFILARHRL